MADIEKLAASLDRLIESELPSLAELYRRLHAAPELSGQEQKTAALVAERLKSLGYTVTEGLGRYRHHDWPGYGVLAVLRNGAGPTLLLRADMDALPIEEKTGLPYASRTACVMHACGHDLHVTCLLGAAHLLALNKGLWQGTLVLVAQPGEEGGGGAEAMLEDGAYRLCPQPDFALALHATLQQEAGTVGYVPGDFMSSFTELEITLHGIGSHGSAPETGKDPIVMAAQLILALQTVVSREKSALEPAVVTVGSIHGGSASNVIPEEVRLQLSIRSYDDRLRDRIVASIERMARGVALTAGIPEERAPQVTLKASHPANYNDPELTGRVAEILERGLGAERVLRGVPVMVSEDFALWGMQGRIPTCMLWLGGADPERFAASLQSGIPLPSIHSPLFAPLPEPSIATGVKALSLAALRLLEKRGG